MPATLVVSGVSSGVGKTSIAVGIMAALSKRGMRLAVVLQLSLMDIRPSILISRWQASSSTRLVGTPTRNGCGNPFNLRR